MRDQFNQWRGKTKTGSMRVGRWIRRHTVLAAVALLLTVLMSPRKVQGQLPSPCCAILAAGLGTINSTLGSVIGGGLQAINTVLSDISNFEQTVVWPRQAIAQALGMAGQIQGFYTQIRAIFQIPIATATLQNPRQLESILLSRSAGQIPNTTGGYAAVYGVVPTPQNAPPPVRDIIDMTDAVAQDAMERAIAIDAIADQELAAADQINTNVQSATPGSAPIIEAQADAWLVEEIAAAFGTKKFAQTFRRMYPKCENISVDYAILEPRSAKGEQKSNIFCLPASFGWNDLGSWTALHEHHVAKRKPQHDNLITSDGVFTLNAEGNYVHAPGKFIAAIGVSNLVVVETEDALLITTREHAQDVGKVVKHLDEKKMKKLV